MGYYGLSHYSQSDKAWDLHNKIIKHIIKDLDIGLEDEANEYNTKGCINVAMIMTTTWFKKLITDNIDDEDLIKLFIKCDDKLVYELERKDINKDYEKNVGKLYSKFIKLFDKYYSELCSQDFINNN